MKKLLAITKNYAIMTIGAIITAFSIVVFLAPNKLAAGGVSGIATVLHYVLDFPIGVISLVLNIPLFALGIMSQGKSFGIKSMYSTVMLSLFIDIFSFIKPVTNDLLLASLFGGLLSGLGLGLVFVAGATTGGSDIIATLLQKIFRHMSMGRLLLFTDLSVIAFATIMFKNLQTGLYSVIALYASSYMIDTLLEGVGYAKTVFIVSDNYAQIADSISSELKRGVTGIYGLGMYSGKNKTILMCTMKRNEIPKLKDVVRKNDEKAFVILADVREVLGEGFKNYE